LDGVARIDYGEGVLLMTSYDAFETDLVIAEAESCACRYGEIVFEIQRQRMMVRAEDPESASTCASCARRVPVTFVTGEGDGICVRCVRELVRPVQ
jgi:hypothetical protein